MENKKKIAKETIDVLEKGYTTTKRIHEEYESAKKKYAFFKHKLNQQYYGKWQYVFEKGNLKISLITFVNKKKENWFWEIHAHEDKRLFEGTKRFSNKKDAMREIDNLLGG